MSVPDNPSFSDCFSALSLCIDIREGSLMKKNAIVSVVKTEPKVDLICGMSALM